MAKKAELRTLLIGMDIIGFALLFVGAALIRFSKDDFGPIIGGFVVAGGIAIISITRMVHR